MKKLGLQAGISAPWATEEREKTFTIRSTIQDQTSFYYKIQEHHMNQKEIARRIQNTECTSILGLQMQEASQ
jgi:hypothetical protein